MRTIALVLLLSFALVPVTHAGSLHRGRFWKEFRKAFLQENFKALRASTRFPVEVKGMMDEDPVLKVTRKRFDACFAQIYGKDTGLSVQGQTHRDFIGTMLQVPQTETGEESFRIADLVFARGQNGYELVRFYLDTDDSKVAKKCR